VQSKGVVGGHFIGVEYDFVSVVYEAVHSDTPGFVPDDAFAVLAC
jgi:hypothetical protein